MEKYFALFNGVNTYNGFFALVFLTGRKYVFILLPLISGCVFFFFLGNSLPPMADTLFQHRGN